LVEEEGTVDPLQFANPLLREWRKRHSRRRDFSSRRTLGAQKNPIGFGS
jgi:hypothetical protein